MYNFSRTIAAISTPPGKGGVALIRISGEGAFGIADACFRPYYGETPLSSRKARTAIRGDIHHEGETIDDGIAILYPAPHSYTGEDTVEITCHGGVLVTRMVLEALFSAGAVPAEAGEFTRRAFLNGTITLNEAESIGNLLDATCVGQVRLAAKDSRTKLSQALLSLHEEMVSLLGSLWAVIDYPEEDLAELTNEELCARLRALQGKITALCGTYRTGRAIQEGIETVIVGRPNVGKSSLYNLLCCEEAAIVTDVAGTTRDILTRTVALGDVTLRLCDTAGLRETEDSVERIGVARSRSRMEEAELIFAVFDGASPLTQEDLALIDTLKALDATVIAILNKADVGSLPMPEIYESFPHVLSLSAKEGDTVALTSLVQTLFMDGDIRIGDTAIVSQARQYAALKQAEALVESTLRALEAGLPADVACSDLELALGAIGKTDGRAVSEDVVANIFSHFCVGK